MSSRQSEYLPATVSPPGDTLLELLEERDMSQAELADRCGRPKKLINEIVKGKTSITPETALQLENVLGTPAAFWIQRERSFRESIARRKEREELSQHVGWLSRFPGGSRGARTRSTNCSSFCASSAWPRRTAGILRRCSQPHLFTPHSPSRCRRRPWKPGSVWARSKPRRQTAHLSAQRRSGKH